MSRDEAYVKFEMFMQELPYALSKLMDENGVGDLLTKVSVSLDVDLPEPVNDIQISIEIK